jgi:quinol monooxygenase YgiN
MRSTPKSHVKVMSALLTARPDKQEEFLQTLLSLKEEIQRQPGCLDCTIGREVAEELRFFIFMVWKDLAHLEAHLDSEAFRILLGATSVLTAPAGFRFIAADSAFSPNGFLSRGRRAPAHDLGFAP